MYAMHTLYYTDLGKINLWFDFKLEQIFEIAPAASKIDGCGQS
jgi:hypothetical protein